MIKKMASLFILLICLLCFSHVQLFPSEKEELKQIQQAIEAKGANWTAGSNWVTKLTPEKRKRLCGTLLQKPDPAQAPLISLPQSPNLPAKFDWRNNNGNWITPVTNQGGCGSCWDFSAVAQVEAWWKIANTNLDSIPDLSEQFVLSCSDGSCAGWSVEGALDFIKDNGIPSERCFPYTEIDSIPCANVCSDWQNEAMTIPGWGYVTLNEANVDNIKNAIYLHPISATFIVYSDFFSYTGGVYEHVWGDVEGGHAILIVGWNDEEQSWICKNSWSSAWGLDGYFRIKWGDSEIGSYSPFIWDEIISQPSLQVTKANLEFSLFVGDTLVQTVAINNIGAKPLQFFCNDYAIDINFRFHSTSSHSFDGASWWCGDEKIDGYGDHWLQYLETPVLDILTATSPKLTFRANWSVEDPAGTESPWDGWDGCNVWISTDGGSTFSVISPTFPPYTCLCLWSFGHPEQGWNFGYDIPGWAGLSSGWQQAEFDLTPYAAEKVIIRFALASDLAYSTIDNSELKGLLIDEIKVADGGTIFFENHGEDTGDMKKSGLGNESVAEWLTLKNSGGRIPSNSSQDIELLVKTRNLEAGLYGAKIIVISNDESQNYPEISLTMNLLKPPYDIAIQDVKLPSASLPILFPVDLGVTVANKGQNDFTNFKVLLAATNAGKPVYADTTQVDILRVNETMLVQFAPLLLLEPGELDFSLALLDIANDYNDFNNSATSTASVSNLVDGFETESGFWDFQGGWGITNMGNNGTACAHVNGGQLPYAHNMDASMTFVPGLDISQIDKLTLKFWTRYLTEQNKDICFLEASTDQTNWLQLYSLSGNSFAKWTQHEIGLRQFIDAGADKLWFRFHFISNESTSFVGVLIDDIEVYVANPTNVAAETIIATYPVDWALEQNYPNPFNQETNFIYRLPEPGLVNLTIFNVNGKIVRRVLFQNQNAGNHFVTWDGKDNAGDVVGSGIYFYQLAVKDKFFDTKKMILLK